MLAARRLDGPAGSKYEVLECAGQGAFAQVYRAVQHPIDRIVALKVLDPAFIRSERHRRRFRREARALGRIDHPGVLRMFDYGEQDGQLQLVTEFVEGRTLGRILAAEAPLEPGRALRLTALLLDALAAVHRAGFVHRDVKPNNVMVETDTAGREWVRLVDFGVAASIDEPSHRQEAVGTPRYMAPEQIRPFAVDERADLFAVGAVLYELLSGRPALPTRTARSMLAGGAVTPPAPFDPRLDIHPDVDALIRAALSEAPADRPPTASSMRETIYDLLLATEPHAEPLTFGGDSRTPPPSAAPAVAAGEAPTADLGRIDPFAPTVIHAEVQRRTSVSSPWPSLEFVDVGGERWPADARGTGPLPRLLAPAVARPAGTRAAAAAVSAALDGAGPADAARPDMTQPIGASVCDEVPCWRRSCFWTLLGINAIVLTVSALI